MMGNDSIMSSAELQSMIEDAVKKGVEDVKRTEAIINAPD